MEKNMLYLVLLGCLGVLAHAEPGKVRLPFFAHLKHNYPGYLHHGGNFRNHHLLHMLGLQQNSKLLLHDTSALRLSFALNRIGGVHSLGRTMIHLSKYGQDSLTGKDHLQLIFLPISFGPYLADKYGFPNISKLHVQDPLVTKHNFWKKQGILRVITYTKSSNQPKGHVALWDCDHFHQSKDWIAGHSLLTVEFWESPDSNCEGVKEPDPLVSHPKFDPQKPSSLQQSPSANIKLQSPSDRIKYLKSHLLPKNARHSNHKQRDIRLETNVPYAIKQDKYS